MSSSLASPTAQASQSGPAPHETIWALTNAVVPSTCLHLVAELGVADWIGEEPIDVEELAARCGADSGALDRVLSLLACHGIFNRHTHGYMHTPASSLLRTDHPMSMRGFPRMMGLPLFAAVFSNLEHSVRTGAPAVEAVEPNGLWAYLQDHPDEGRIFDQAMTGKAAADVAAILSSYDFSRLQTIADIGGGRGHLLRAVLDAASAARGVLFDLPAVIDTLEVEHERLTLQAGDFFADPLPAADGYVLMEVLHDWADEQCIEILSAIRQAAAPGAKVLIIENVLTEHGRDPRAHTLDVIMLAVTGGRERTPAQFDRLLTQAGLSTGKGIENPGPLRIIEATAS